MYFYLLFNYYCYLLLFNICCIHKNICNGSVSFDPHPSEGSSWPMLAVCASPARVPHRREFGGCASTAVKGHTLAAVSPEWKVHIRNSPDCGWERAAEHWMSHPPGWSTQLTLWNVLMVRKSRTSEGSGFRSSGPELSTYFPEGVMDH